MMNRLKVRKEVSHGGAIPRGWQMAWYEPRRRVGVYYPAPLHWLLRAIREVVHRVRAAVRAPGIERAEVFQMQRAHRERERLAEEYARGYMAGWRECFQTCLSAVEEEVARVDDTRGRRIISPRSAETSWHGKLTPELRAQPAARFREMRCRPPQCLEKAWENAVADQQTTGERRKNENLGDLRYVLRTVPQLARVARRYDGQGARD